MSGREWQFEPIRRNIWQPLDAVSGEILVLSLLAVGDNGRACGLQLLDRIPDSFVVKFFQDRVRTAVPSDCTKQFQRSWNTPDRLGRNDHSNMFDILRIR